MGDGAPKALRRLMWARRARQKLSVAIGSSPRTPETAAYRIRCREFAPSAFSPQSKCSCGLQGFCRADYLNAGQT